MVQKFVFALAAAVGLLAAPLRAPAGNTFFENEGGDAILAQTPAIERLPASRVLDHGHARYRIKGTTFEGAVIPEEVVRSTLSSDLVVLTVPLESFGSGFVFATLIYVDQAGSWAYAGYVSSDRGHLRVWVEGGYILARIPLYKPSDPEVRPSAHRLARYTIARSKVVELDSTVIAQGQDLPGWLYIEPGRRAYLGTDGEDAPVAIVCPTVKASKRGPAGGCDFRAMGTPIVIASIGSNGYPCDHSTQVQVRAADRSWNGYVNVDAIEPAVPPGTLLQIRPDPDRPGVQPFGIGRVPYKDSGIAMNGATVRVIAFDPKAPDNTRDTAVAVTTGARAGTQGWVFLLDTALKGVPVPPYMVCRNDTRWFTLN